MSQDRETGTAWDRCLSDYAYTRDLDSMGWAWEFLRRNEGYRRDYRMNRAGHPVPIRHLSGATVYRPKRRFLAAENWGLLMFANPDKSAHNVDVFWNPELLHCSVHCLCSAANDNTIEPLSLASFVGRRAVFVGPWCERLIVHGQRKGAYIVVREGTILIGSSAFTFSHDGLKSAFRHFETIKILASLSRENGPDFSGLAGHDSKYRDYLVALDGRLAGRSYRDIAEVVYGRDRVGAYWTDDTRGLKSKVRRAVENGLALMNGGYRDLL